MDVKVVVPKNIHYFQDTDTDLELSYGQEYVLAPRYLKSYGIKRAFLNGQLRVVEGDVHFLFKDSEIVINGVPGGNTFIKIVSKDETTIKHFDEQPDTPAPKVSAKVPTEAEIMPKPKEQSRQKFGSKRK